MIRFITTVFLCSACIGFMFGCSVGRAQEHHHPPEHAQIHEVFYKNWMRPDHPALSCCDLKDCAPATLKKENGTWYGKRATDANWRRIPPEKIEMNRDSPDGRSHMCAALYDSVTVYCAIIGAGN